MAPESIERDQRLTDLSESGNWKATQISRLSELDKRSFVQLRAAGDIVGRFPLVFNATLTGKNYNKHVRDFDTAQGYA